MDSLASKAIGRTRRRAMTHLFHGGLSALASSLVLQMLGSERSGQPLAMGIAVLGAALLAGALGLVIDGKRRRPGEVRVSRDTVRIEREGEKPSVHAREELDAGHVEVSGPRSVVVLTTDARRYEIETEVAEHADALLATIGLDPRKRLVRFARRESGSAFTRATIMLQGAVGLSGAMVYLLELDERTVASTAVLLLTTTLLGLGVGAAVAEKVEPSAVDIGADGVRWLGWFGSKHFVRYRDLKDVVLDGRVLRLVTAARVHTIDLGDTPAATRDAIRRRVETAWFADVPSAALELLARRGQDLATWRAKLSELVREGQEGYRQATIPRVRVEAALEDPDAPPDQRLGAAIALTSTGTNEQRELARRRAAELAKSVADPRLAEAFVEVAHDRLAPRVAERVGDPS